MVRHKESQFRDIEAKIVFILIINSNLALGPQLTWIGVECVKEHELAK